MKAIYKREVKAYLTSMIGYVFIALNLLLVGIYFTYYNLRYGYPYMDYTLSGVSFIFLITTPILTMKVMAEERKQKTDQLLLTSPVRPVEIVLGKYLALVTIFLIPMAVIGLYPLILSSFGTVPLSAAYTALLGYFLLGCAYLALGLFLSSVMESPVLSAVLTFGACFLCYMAGSLESFFSGSSFATFIAFLVIALLVCLLVYSLTKSAAVSGGVLALAAAALCLCYFVKPSLLSGGIQKLMGIFDFGEAFNSFLNGILDLRSVLYYLSAIGLFCFFTVQSIEKRRWGYHHGSYSIGWMAAVVGIVLVVNLTAAELPSRFTSHDMTANQYYTLSDQTKELLDGLSGDVTIYQLTEDGSSDGMVENLLDQYAGHSGHVKVVKKDLVQFPTFASNYTDDTLQAGSLIVESADRYKVISSADLYEYSYDSYYQMYQSGFDGEGQITSAVAYVTSEDIPVIYVLEGHREEGLSTELTGQIEKENLELESLNLVSLEAVPEDAAALLICSPQTDFSEEETEMILNYLKAGGRAFITSTYAGESLPNFNSILEYYGISAMDGVVAEGDSSYYHPQSRLYLLPELEADELTSSLLADNRLVFMPVCQAIEHLEEVRDTVKITSLLTSSASSYFKADARNMTTVEKEADDKEGPFDLAVKITEQAEDAEQETQILYFASGYLLDEQMNQTVSGGNYELVMNGISSLAGHENTVAIAVKSMEVEYLTITAAGVNTFSIAVTAILPGLLLVTGGIIWYRRRKR